MGEVISESKMIECERCKKWICYECHKITEKDSTILKIEGVHWVCLDCNKETIKILNNLSCNTVTQNEEEKLNRIIEEQNKEIQVLKEINNKLKEKEDGEEKNTANDKKEGKRKDNEINKMKKEINEYVEKLEKVMQEIHQQNATISNLNENLITTKEINKQLETRLSNEWTTTQVKNGDITRENKQLGGNPEKQQICYYYSRHGECKYENKM